MSEPTTVRFYVDVPLPDDFKGSPSQAIELAREIGAQDVQENGFRYAGRTPLPQVSDPAMTFIVGFVGGFLVGAGVVVSIVLV